jgi:hypothetical protein
MLREHMINFLEATVVFLLMTNALSILAATWAISLLNGRPRLAAVPAAINRKLDAVRRRAS